jgi:hypothetical protein
MFERYTEKARRVIFFGRYEASQYGSPVIDSEHLLLGLLREDIRTTMMLPAGASEAIRRQINARAPKHDPIPTSVDMPLSEAASRVLKYGTEEADRLNHRHIGCEHLLLGLLRERGCFAAELLESFGLKLEEARTRAEVASAYDAAEKALSSGHRVTVAPPGTVLIHGMSVGLQYVALAIRRFHLHNWHWQKSAWKPRDICVNRKTGRISLDVSLAADAENFELLKGGWKKDHCAICRWELHESEDDHGTGYTNGRDWICTECYDKFWDRPNFVSGSYSDLT